MSYFYETALFAASHNGENIRPMKKIFILLAMCVLAPALKAKIAVAKSIEWLAVDADHILIGKIISTSTAKGKGNSGQLTLCTFEESGRLKSTEAAEKRTWHFAIPDYPAYGPEKLPDGEVIVFLRETKEGFAHEGNSYNLWPLEAPRTEPAIIDLSAPGNRLMTARGFKTLKEKKEIIEHCEHALKKLEEYKSSQTDKVAEIKEARLEIPFETQVHELLYSRSACYLIVPKFMFPEAED
jgi:hypothetical protein